MNDDDDDERRTTTDDDGGARSRRELGSSAEFLLRIVQASDRLPDASDVSRLRGRGRKRSETGDPPLDLRAHNVKWLCRQDHKHNKNVWQLNMRYRDSNGEWHRRCITPHVMGGRVYG